MQVIVGQLDRFERRMIHPAFVLDEVMFYVAALPGHLEKLFPIDSAGSDLRVGSLQFGVERGGCLKAGLEVFQMQEFDSGWILLLGTRRGCGRRG